MRKLSYVCIGKQLTGRLPLICAATAVHAALFCAVLGWRPQAGDGYVLYVFAVLWGLCDSVWIVQINGTYIYVVCRVLMRKKIVVQPNRSKLKAENDLVWARKKNAF